MPTALTCFKCKTSSDQHCIPAQYTKAQCSTCSYSADPSHHRPGFNPRPEQGHPTHMLCGYPFRKANFHTNPYDNIKEESRVDSK